MSLVTPMRAADLKGDLTLIAEHHYPVVLSPKFDGYRATTQPAQGPIAQAGMRDIIVYSKNNKPIPNAYVQQQLGHWTMTMLDGELIVGDPLEPGSLQRTSSGVTTRAGEPDFNFWVFDDIARLDLPFISRLARLSERFKKQLRGTRVCLVPHKIVLNVKELIAYENLCVKEGWEGVMVRARDGDYKQGGVEPRSKVGKGVLGGCRVIGVGGRWDGVRYDVGGGWTDAQRAELWAVRDTLAGRVMKVETGITPDTFKAPQFPRWVDWKWEGDL
jgi:DNA ligase-1